jgi:uncharacterized delta-60 repeat protein
MSYSSRNLAPRTLLAAFAFVFTLSFAISVFAQGDLQPVIDQFDPFAVGAGYEAHGYENYRLNLSASWAGSRSTALATGGAIDPAFNPVLDTTPGLVRATAVQPDGKIVIGGFFRTLAGTRFNNIVRLNADRSVDSSFSATTNGTVQALVVQPDGKIVVGGAFTAVNGAGQNYIARLLPNGAVDTAFNTFGGASNLVYGLALQPDGKILLSGSFEAVAGALRPYVARLNSDGSLDTGFTTTFPLPAPPNFTPSIVYSISLQPDNKVVIGGLVVRTPFPTQTVSAVLRLNPDGSVDSSFDAGNINSNLLKVAVQSDSKILISGFFTSVNGTPRNRIARLNSNGSLDTSFDPGVGADGVVYTFTVRPDNSIFIGGNFANYNGVPRRNIALIGTDGHLDTGFTPTNSIGFAYSIVPNTDGTVLVAGSILTIIDPIRDTLLLFSANGTLNPGLNLNSTGFGATRALAVQPDGSLLVAGNFGRVNGTSRLRVARINTNGTLDSTFNPGTANPNPISALLLQPDGRILVGSGTVVRLNGDGSTDTSFTQAASVPSRSIRAIAMQPDGKILISYTIALLGQPDAGDISRLNPDGSLDASFDGLALPFEAIAVLPDGKILAGGPVGFAYVGSGMDPEIHNGIFRLNADGSHDRTFRSGFVSNTGGAGFTSVYSIEPQANGKILVGGSLYSAASTSPVAVARLDAGGTVDGSFALNTVTSAYEFPRAKKIRSLASGKIMVAGLFNHIGLSAQNNLARLNANGAVDSSFTTGTDGPVSDFAIDASGRIVFGGDFEIAGGLARTGLARTLAEVAGRTPYDFDGDGRSDISVFRPSSGAWYLLRSTAGYTGVSFGAAGDQLAPADYDGDGKTDIAVFRDGAWYILGSQVGFLAYNFGSAGDIPQPADFTGDGRAELAVFRPANGGWYKLDLNGNVFTAVGFGQNGDKPVVGDYDGDGKADPAVFRDGAWFILGSTQGFQGVTFGIAGDRPVPADYDGDGKTDEAVYRDGAWYLLRSTAGFTGQQWGVATDLPAAGDYDGDGKSDLAVFRDGQWYLLGSTAGYQGVAFGSAGDKPIPNAFVH